MVPKLVFRHLGTKRRYANIFFIVTIVVSGKRGEVFHLVGEKATVDVDNQNHFLGNDPNVNVRVPVWIDSLPV